MLTLLSLLSAFTYDSTPFYISGNRYPYHPVERPVTTTHVLFMPFFKNEEREIVKDKEKGIWNRITDSMRNIMSGLSLFKITIIIIMFFIAVALGYHVRKSEEQSNYVRLPASS